MRRVIVACVGAAALTLSAGVLAQHHGGFGGRGMAPHAPAFGHSGMFTHPFHHAGFRSHVAVFFGPPLFWGPEFFVYGYPNYYAYPYPAGYAQPAPVQWYCPDQGYYPAVRSCERGWLRVLPQETPSY